MSVSIAEELAQQLAAGFAAQDISALLHPEVVVWHNFDQREVGKDAFLASLQVFYAVLRRNELRNCRYGGVRRWLVPDGFLQQHVIEADGRAGSRFRMPAFVVVTVRDRLIARIEEYMDPTPFVRLASAAAAEIDSAANSTQELPS